MQLIEIYQNVRKRYGAIGKIAERSGKHRNTVTAILQGRLHDSNVVRIATEVLLELEQEDSMNMKEAEKTMKQLEALQAA
ncbi:MAG: hypothetical protein IPJ74_09405 [Saprospiraceae bacterium]|nr:hypothetical protein [Saprospiraceae bacterium]